MVEGFIKPTLEHAAKEGIALTYDDVSLKTRYSEVLPNQVSTETKFSRRVSLKIPIASAAMDTVTEYKLAIELAKLGGIGVIHKNLTPEEQARQVAKVKHHLNAFIEKPIYFFEDETIEEVLKRKAEKGYGFSSFLVTNREGRLVGIVTETDFEFFQDSTKPVSSIMTLNPVTAPVGTQIESAYDLMCRNKKKALPVIDETGRIAGMYVFSDIKRIKGDVIEPYNPNLDKKGQLIAAAAIGVYDDAFARLEKLVEENIDVVVIDSAHGCSKGVIETLRDIKSRYLDVDVVVGNITTEEQAKILLDAGADGIKVGQGPGGICTTRKVAGVGTPQITSIYRCAKAVYGTDNTLCADGGLKYSGDITKAIAAGANSVMMGSMLAGTEEAPGDLIFVDGRQWKNYRGMGSIGAMEIGRSARQRYGQENVSIDKLVPEGVEARIPYKGKLRDIIHQYIGGLRAGMGYTGSKTIDELRQNGEFDRITLAGDTESHPHGVTITREAPNYPGN